MGQMLTRLTVVITSQYRQTSNHYAVYLKQVYCYMSIITLLKKKMYTSEICFLCFQHFNPSQSTIIAQPGYYNGLLTGPLAFNLASFSSVLHGVTMAIFTKTLNLRKQSEKM